MNGRRPARLRTAVCEPRAKLIVALSRIAPLAVAGGVAAALWLPAAAGAGFAPGATVHTEMIQYTYNTDGALTGQRTTLDQGGAQTTYFTWDDFLPAAEDPTTGTISAGNGNLLGYGPAPGNTAGGAFSFDRRNRLTGYAGAGQQVAYAYTAGGLLAAASPASGSGLRFYHDAAARMTNLRQGAGTATELWSGDLGGVRTVGDGAEQVRLRPRKDVAGTYDAGSETVATYRYDAYGAQSAAASTEYDIHANPVQYAGEYRDALWGGSYLRARWYAPELPLFLSRDPVAHLGRYGYAGGNPVMRVDPSGRSWKSFENSFAHGRMGWQRWLQHLGGSNAWYSHLARLTAGMLVGPLQIVANPAGFTNAIAHGTGGMDIFLAAGVMSGIGLGNAVALAGAESIFAARLSLEGAIGVGQSVTAAAAGRGFRHFNWSTYAAGLEYTANPLLLEGLGRAAHARWGSSADGEDRRLARRSIDHGSLDTIASDRDDAAGRQGPSPWLPTSPRRGLDIIEESPHGTPHASPPIAAPIGSPPEFLYRPEVQSDDEWFEPEARRVPRVGIRQRDPVPAASSPSTADDSPPDFLYWSPPGSPRLVSDE